MTTGGVKDGSETHGSAANHEVTPTMRLMTLQAGHKALDAKITEFTTTALSKPVAYSAAKKRKAAFERCDRAIEGRNGA